MERGPSSSLSFAGLTEQSCPASWSRPLFRDYKRCSLQCLSLYTPTFSHVRLQGTFRARSGSSTRLGTSGRASVLRPAGLLTRVQISLQTLPRAYLNSLAPVKSGRLNIVQTSRLLPGFKNLLKILLAILLYHYHEFSL